jgi:C-terminal processing protease CtpA/Prc
MKNYLILIVLLLTFSSCEKVLMGEDKASSNPIENFEYLWNEVDKKYSYFELKNIDWNEVKLRYQDSLKTEMTEEQLFHVLGSMLNELRDDHTNLISPFNVSVYNIALKNPKNYNERTIREFYLPEVMQTGAFQHGFLDSNEIGYLRYNSFMSQVTNEDLDYILNRYKDTKGLIIDVRENGGGNMFNIPLIMERFVEERKLVAYSKTRNGIDHNDFTEPDGFYFNPYEGVRYTKPVVILIDRGSYSATTFFSLSSKALDNITLVGDTTGGGGGLPNGGQLPNGWTYRFSITQLLDLNLNNFAESGVPPDILESFDWSDLTKDKILDRAILELN